MDTMPLEVVQQKTQQWNDLKKQLEELKAKELVLRMEIINGIFPNIQNDPDLKGTLTCNLPDGSALKSEAKFNVTVDAELLSTQREFYITEQLIPIDLIFNYKPSLAASNYDKLPKEQKDILSEVVSFERATPSLKFVPAKESKK